MLRRNGFLPALSTMVVVAAAVAAPAAENLPASGSHADRAAIMLQKALAEYKAMDFAAAKATLLRIDADVLLDQDRQTLTEHLGLVDAGIRGQNAAGKVLSDAREALDAGRNDEARRLLIQIIGSPFLPKSEKTWAAKQVVRLSDNPRPTAAPTAGTSKAAVVPVPKQPAGADDADRDRIMRAVAARQEKARRLLAQAKGALDANKPADARTLLQQALGLDPDLEEAKKHLKFAEGLLGIDDEAGALTHLARRTRIARQLNDLEIDKALGRSNECLARSDKAEDFKAALNGTRIAVDLLTTHKHLYTRKEYRDQRTLIENQIKFIQMRQEQWVQARMKQQVDEMRQIEAERVQRTEQEQRRNVQTLLTRAKTLKHERKFKQALEQIQRVLTLDPNNRWAAEQKEDLTQLIILQDEKAAVKERDYQTTKVLIDNQRSEIPWWQELQYPKDWRSLTDRRKEYAVTAIQESERDRQVRKRLQERIRELNFDGIELSDVIQFLRDVSGVNIYVKWNALNAAGISKNTTVNVHLQDVALEKALKIILEDVGASAPLGYVLDEGVVTVSTQDDLTTKTLTKVYDIRDLIFRPPNFVGPRLGTGSSANNNNAVNNVSTDVGGEILGEGEEVSSEEIVNDILNLIRTTIAPDSWQDTNRIGIQELRGQMIITQTAQNHEKIGELLGRLREARAIQIAIETRFIQVQDSFLEQIGVEFGVTQEADDFSSLSNAVTWWPSVDMDWAHGQGATQVGLDIAGLAVPNAFELANSFLDDITVTWLVRATQANANARVFDAPRVTLMNGQRSYILVETNVTYVREFTLTREVIDPNTQETRQIIDVTTDTMRTGVMLDVQATISDDRRYVTLTVRPQLVTGTTRTLTLTGVVDDPTTQILSAIQLPNLLTTELETSVHVPDGGTLLLGGLKQTNQQERELGVPILSKIPILNRLTTNRGMTRDDDILLILIKPKILIQVEQEELAFP